MRVIKRYIAILAVLFLFLFLGGCFKTKTFQITFIDDNDQVIEEKIYEKGEQIVFPDAPNKTGYDFTGWDNDDTVATKDIVFKALYEAKSFTVSFVSDGDEVIGNLDILYGEILNLPSASKTGYYFYGWKYEDLFVYSGTTYDYLFNIELTAIFVLEIESMPVLYIDLGEVKLKDVNRTTYVDASVSLTNTLEEFEFSSLAASFRGRGHGSWVNYDKKGYRIKFDKKQAVFGYAKSKHWVIVPGGHDDSLIRHNLAYTIVNENLSYIEYQTSVHEIEVYVNGIYHGVYSLFEHIRVEKGRVDITSEYNILDTGYLLEYDAYAYEEGTEGIDYFKVQGLKYPFVIKSPDPDDYLDEGLTKEEYKSQVNYIKDYVGSVVNAILTADYQSFNELADVNSFVDMYIIHELFKNTDTGYSSFYLYKKKGGKLYAGPAWDFDLSSGISRGDSSYTGFYVSDKVKSYSFFTSSEIYIALMKQDWFKTRFAERFLEVEQGILQTINMYYLKIGNFSLAYKRDADRWTSGIPRWQTEQIALKNWLTNRVKWLKNWALNQ